MGRTKDLFRWTFLLATLALQALPGGLPAATGGPDSAGYTWADRSSGCIPDMQEFGPAALRWNLPLSAVGPISLGFVMPFHGRAQREIWISPTGFVAFSDQAPFGASTDNQWFPNPDPPNHLLAAYWKDETATAMTAEALSGRFHVRWEFLDPGGGAGLVDLMLNRDGRIEMLWDQIVAPGTTATVGHEDETGNVGTAYFYNGIVMEPFFPIPGLSNVVCLYPPDMLDCTDPVPASCDVSVPSDLPADPVSEADVYSCTGDAYEGNERLVRLDLDTPRQVSVEIDAPGLDLFQISGPPDCSEQDCLAIEDRRMDFDLLLPGSYWFAVDKQDEGGGDPFQFTTTCTDLALPVLSCGSSAVGDTAGGSVALDRHTCVRGALDGPEVLYRLSHTRTETLVLTLETPQPDLYVVLYDSAGNCLAGGPGGVGLRDARAGEYLVVVDGRNGASGTYTIDAFCGPPLSPGSLEVTLRAGSDVPEEKTAILVPAFLKADILFAMDLTTSMIQEQLNLRNQAKQIIQALTQLVPDLMFGLASFMDYPQQYQANRNCGYGELYGAPGDFPYQLDLPLTTDALAFEEAVDLMVVGDGEDNPEAYARLLWETVHDGAIGWRDHSRRIVVMFGDQIPHDCQVDACVGGTQTTGIDPGRDEAVGTGDDILLMDALGQMAGAPEPITLLHFDSSEELAVFELWQCLAEVTGGSAWALNTDGSVPSGLSLLDLIYDAILSESRRCANLTLEPSPGFESWLVSMVPQAYLDLVIPAGVPFDIRIGAPPGTPAGDYTFTIFLVCDGSVIGEQQVTVHVAACTLHVEAPEDMQACEGTEIVLRDAATMADGCAGQVQFQWSRDGAVIRPWDADPAVTDTVGSEGAVYTLELRCFGDSGCGGKASDSLVVTPLPDPIPPPLGNSLLVEKASGSDARIRWVDLPGSPDDVASYQVVAHDLDAHGIPDPASMEAAFVLGTEGPGVQEMLHAGALRSPCDTGGGDTPCRLIGYKVRATSPCSERPGPCCNPFPAQVDCP